MNKVILLLTAVFGLSVAAFAADPSPSPAAPSAEGSPSAKKHHTTTHHHSSKKAKASPSASPTS